MSQELITKDDLEKFRQKLLEDIKSLMRSTEEYIKINGKRTKSTHQWSKIEPGRGEYIFTKGQTSRIR